jgi:fatty-acyl-CoA synthase
MKEWNVLRDPLLHRANSQPEELAFAAGDETLTFSELAEHAVARGAALQKRGVQPGTRVALAMSAGLQFVETFWALQIIGAIPCAFNPHVPAATLASRIDRIKPGLVITDEAADQPGPTSGAVPPELDGDDPAFFQLTSGTSGEPRASVIRHRNVLTCLHQSEGLVHGGLVRDERKDVFVAWVPPWHDLGLVRFVIGTVYHGLSCHIVTPSVRTIPEWLHTISDVGGTWSGAPDFAYRLATRMVSPQSIDLSSLRFMVNGGEPVRWSSIQEFEQRFSVPGVVMPGYGLGEATLAVCSNLPGNTRKVDERGNVSCGRPMPGLEVRAGTSTSEPEEIRVRGESVFSGYFEAKEDTERALRDGWLHTGDSGYLDEEGWLYVLGRRRVMIKRAGAVIAPREIEEAAHRARGVRLAAAASVPAGGVGEASIVVAVEADPSEDRAKEDIAADVIQEVVSALGFAPDRVQVVPARTIPRTDNGKVRHAMLVDALQALPAA